MPTYNIMIGNRAYKVELTKKSDDGLFEAEINGRPVRVEFKRSRTRSISPSTIKVGARSFKLELERVVRNQPFDLKIQGSIFKAELIEPTSNTQTRTPVLETDTIKPIHTRKELPAQEGTIVAPMAGKIVSVNAKKGDSVEIGDVICILEAMKMENEILATKAGEIKEINLVAGKPVRVGDILALIG